MQDNSGKDGKDQKSWIDRVWNRNESSGKDGKEGEPGGSRPRVPSWLIGVLILALVGWYLYQNFIPRSDSATTSVPYSVVTAQIDAGNVTEATISDSSITVELENPVYWNKTDETIETASGSGNVEAEQLKATIPPVVQTNNQELMNQLAAQDVIVHGEQESSSLWTGLLVSFLPLLLFLGLIIFMGRQMTRGQQNVFGFGRSRARQHDPGAAPGDLCRRRRRRRSQARADRGGRLPAQSRQVPPTWRTPAARGAAGRTSRHRQDLDGARRGR